MARIAIVWANHTKQKTNKRAHGMILFVFARFIQLEQRAICALRVGVKFALGDEKTTAKRTIAIKRTI